MSSYDFVVTNTDEIELKLTVVMTLKNWKELRSSMSDTNYCTDDFRRKITEMTRYAEARFYPKEEEEE